MDLLQNSYFSIFLIIALGYILGSIKIKGVSLDVSAVIFIALLFGHFGVVIPEDLQTFGMILFIFTIGIQAGPGFIDSFKSKGRDLAILTIILTGAAGVVSYLFAYFLDLDSATTTGIFAGAITSTPGLATAIEVTRSPLASIGYGIAYPFGVIGVIVFVKLLPKILRINLPLLESKLKKEEVDQYPALYGKVFRVENENVIGKTIEQLKIRKMTGANISRIMHGNNSELPSPGSILELGDLIKAVGTLDSLSRVGILIGPEESIDLPLKEDYELQSILLTNKKLVGKTIGSLNLWSSYNATATRVRRSGVELTPDSFLQMKFGDKFLIAGSKANLKQIAMLLGNDDKAISATDFFPIAAGIVLGIICGKISINIGNEFTFSPGLTGGVLIVAIFLSNLGKTGPIMWTMTGAANSLLRQLGLLLFLAGVGTSAGAHLVSTFEQHGFTLFFAGAAITIITMFIATIVGHYVFKMNVLYLMGAITGGMTSTPGLAATDSMTKTNIPVVAYATVYPIALVLKIIVIQIIAFIMS